MEYANIGVPMFDGQNYAFWRKRMKTYIQAHGFDVWKAVVDGYTTPTTPPTDRDGKKLSENNSRPQMHHFEWPISLSICQSYAL
jgi:hypothetical protein